MHELELILTESTNSSLVLRSLSPEVEHSMSELTVSDSTASQSVVSKSTDADPEPTEKQQKDKVNEKEFWVALTPELRSGLLSLLQESPGTDAHSSTSSESSSSFAKESTSSEGNKNSVSGLGSNPDNEATAVLPPVTEESLPSLGGTASTQNQNSTSGRHGDSFSESRRSAQQSEKTTQEKADSGKNTGTAHPTLKLSPKEIQKRIRHGASAESLSEEMGVPLQRIDSFAYPILLERQRMAELAREAHPVRPAGTDDSHTLWEVLAISFAARGDQLQDADWDAYMDVSNHWLVTISWHKHGSPLIAEFILKTRTTEGNTVTAHNSVAADLIDPNFSRAVRTVSTPSSHSPSRHPASSKHLLSQSQIPDYSAHSSQTDLSTDVGEDEDFLQHPESTPPKKPHPKRRSAAMPRWEDVLLGVRTGSKKTPPS